jgi:membrane-bound lytic murein transglycosylase D
LRGVTAAGVLALLAACAAQPTQPAETPAAPAVSPAPVLAGEPARVQPEPKPKPVEAATRPSGGPAGTPPERPAKLKSAGSPDPVPTVALLDAGRLPPFEGEEQVLGESPPAIAKVDLTAPPDDIWQRIRLGFAMPDLAGPLVEEKLAQYTDNPEYLRRMFDRSRLYLHHIVEELERRGMPTELALLPMVESAFNPMAYSRAHASGLWQFIPPTGKRYALKQNWWFDARRDIVESTAAALGYLADLYDMHGDWHLALASYNYGENGVARAIERNRAAGLPTDYASLGMPLETRYYVPKLQALKNIIADPQAFGIALDPIPNEPYFATVTKTRDIDVQLAAKLAEMPVEEFIALNPGYSRPIIPVSVNPRLVLPADKVDVFHANLEKYDDKTLVSWKTYRPKRGEALDAIARKYKVSVAHLKEVNGITRRSRAIPPVLVVPVNGGAATAARLPIMYAPPHVAPPPRRGSVHRVKSGETLYAIARRYRVSVESLMRWNRISGHVTAGQTLKIRGTSSAAGRRAAGKARSASAPTRRTGG